MKHFNGGITYRELMDAPLIFYNACVDVLNEDQRKENKRQKNLQAQAILRDMKRGKHG